MVNQPVKPKKFVIPITLLLLDLVGLAIVGLGIAEQIGRIQMVPAALHFDSVGLVIMLCGLLCMMPLVWKLLTISKLAKQEEAEWLQGLSQDLQQKLSEKINRESTK